MAAVQIAQYTDIIVKHSENHPKDLFKCINHSIQWIMKSGLMNFACLKRAQDAYGLLYNGFNVIDLMGNANNLFKHFWEVRSVEDLSEEIADTITSITETTSWTLSSKIFTVGAVVSNLLCGLGGMSMTYFFTRKTYATLDFLSKNSHRMSQTAIDYQHFLLTKSISLLAFGILLSVGTIFSLALSPILVLALTTAALIGDLGKNYIKDINPGV